MKKKKFMTKNSVKEKHKVKMNMKKLVKNLRKAINKIYEES